MTVEHEHKPEPLPRLALIAVALLVVVTIIFSAVGHKQNIGTLRMPQMEPAEERTISFKDRNDGAVVVYDSRIAQIIQVLEPGTNGFLRGVMRGFARDRRSRGIDSTPPFRLSRLHDGRLFIEDPQTGRVVDLGAFGETNLRVFMGLFESKGSADG